MTSNREGLTPSAVPPGVDPKTKEALGQVRQAMPEQGKELARKIFTDTLIPAMGNKAAYHDFLSRNHDKGVHVHVDLNDFGEFNKQHGDHTGDEVIQAFGNMSNKLSRLYKGKSHRFGGDEFKYHFNDFRHARKFTSDLTGALEKAPAVRGHKLSISLGMGSNRDHAERALIEAKEAKKGAGAPAGTAANHIRSSIEFKDKE